MTLLLFKVSTLRGIVRLEGDFSCLLQVQQAIFIKDFHLLACPFQIAHFFEEFEFAGEGFGSSSQVDGDIFHLHGQLDLVASSHLSQVEQVAGQPFFDPLHGQEPGLSFRGQQLLGAEFQQFEGELGIF